MADATAEFGGTMTATVLNLNPDAIPEPDTLFIHMTRGEKRIRDEIGRAFGAFKRIVIDVDGERHEYDAEEIIRLLERLEVRDG